MYDKIVFLRCATFTHTLICVCVFVFRGCTDNCSRKDLIHFSVVSSSNRKTDNIQIRQTVKLKIEQHSTVIKDFDQLELLTLPFVGRNKPFETDTMLSIKGIVSISKFFQRSWNAFALSAISGFELINFECVALIWIRSRKVGIFDIIHFNGFHFSSWTDGIVFT